MIPLQSAPLTKPLGATNGKGLPAIPMETSEANMTPAIPTVSMDTAQRSRPTTPEEIAAEVRARLTHELRRKAARRNGALLAADRLGDAEAVASLTLHYAEDDIARAALLECGMRAGRLALRSEVHLAWLDEISRGAGR